MGPIVFGFNRNVDLRTGERAATREAQGAERVSTSRDQRAAARYFPQQPPSFPAGEAVACAQGKEHKSIASVDGTVCLGRNLSRGPRYTVRPIVAGGGSHFSPGNVRAGAAPSTAGESTPGSRCSAPGQGSSRQSGSPCRCRTRHSTWCHEERHQGEVRSPGPSQATTVDRGGRRLPPSGRAATRADTPRDRAAANHEICLCQARPNPCGDCTANRRTSRVERPAEPGVSGPDRRWRIRTTSRAAVPSRPGTAGHCCHGSGLSPVGPATRPASREGLTGPFDRRTERATLRRQPGGRRTELRPKGALA